ncbi:Fur family transcriptional regulator [Clostridium sp. YIM B02515]|uniref:Manganese transport regulator n=1 Tax=Clostridium rhizosphaerae TaxID=2803861 RepID=A0ABS1TDX3_9CLOT|nr:iron dependent repressor, metal binding and dimerization domain protein [Clostridium rhizosphaerae]MBL4937562.1 Fur family transcriptional regulator [Clostridium rhizosphaerae]
MNNKDFYTFSEYMKKEDNSLTASMEDYLEMIYRLSKDLGFTRIHDLSEALNVQPPSATKMVQKLAELSFLKYEKYGVIMLKEEGKMLGELLLKRHNTIKEFLEMLGVSEKDTLEETEKVEHTISKTTVQCFETFINFMKENPDIYEKYKSYFIER